MERNTYLKNKTPPTLSEIIFLKLQKKKIQQISIFSRATLDTRKQWSKQLQGFEGNEVQP